jgi:phytoene/squalene synthetase
MTTAESSASSHGRFCWEQVARTHRLFRISRIFAAPGTVAALLPLYALFSSVEEICASVSDEGVARRKLEWWGEECLGRTLAKSSHPVILELVGTGAAERVDWACFAEILRSAAGRLDAPPPSDLGELETRCLAIARPQAQMELAVCGCGGAKQQLEEGRWLAVNGLAQLLREGRLAWLPMALSARHGVTRESLAGGDWPDGARILMGEVSEAAAQWGAETLIVAGDGFHQARHLAVITGLNRGKIMGLPRRGAGKLASELNRSGFAELYLAWREARRFSRP